jgi:hypothetical protein
VEDFYSFGGPKNFGAVVYGRTCATLTAQCDAGAFVTGGGFSARFGNGAAAGDVRLLSSHPNSAPQGWTVIVCNDNHWEDQDGGDHPIDIIVNAHAMCLKFQIMKGGEVLNRP